MTLEEQHQLDRFLNTIPSVDELENILSEDDVFLISLELDATSNRPRERRHIVSTQRLERTRATA